MAILHHMKTSIKITALFLAASFPGVSFAEILGAPIPAVLNVETVSIAFSLLVLGLIGVGDYTRRMRPLRAAPVVAPTAPRPETHRLAA
jgi:hypothetical protein